MSQRYLFKPNETYSNFLKYIQAQCATIEFSTKSKASNKTYPGLITMLQEIQKCIT